jgi:signal transduction histidine kinase
VWRVAADPMDGGLWLGLYSGGVVHLVDGAIRASYSADDGLGKGSVNDLRVTEDGNVWAATSGGLSRIKAGRVATLNAKNGLPCDPVISSVEDGDGSTWMYMGCGLVRIARPDLDAWIAAVDQGKDAPSIQMTVLDNSDGVQSLVPPGNRFTPLLVVARDGKLWFPTQDGLTWVDPRHLSGNTIPPPVHIEQVIADRKAYEPSSQLSLPALVRDLAIDYTALSLVAPEKMQFRYRVEGRDRDWQDAGNRRQAFYTDLAPGNYRFRVIASNNSGVWNEEGTTLAFSIAPAYWQTNWFLALSAAAFALLLSATYQIRAHQLARAAARDRELQMELIHANRLAAMGQLTASIVHEVNQPLGATVASASAALRWLKAQPPNLEEVRQALDGIVRASHRASDVVMHIRGLVKRAPAQEADVSLNEEIMGVLTITRSEALKHDVAVRTELVPDLPIVIGDRVQLQQVLLNLIVNAIEAMSTLTGETRELVVRSEQDGGGGVVVSVHDTGPGLEPAALERLFEPFYTSKKTGLGMGLSICRTIIEAHEGRLWASANKPRGAIFQFTLPARSAVH